MQEWVSVLRRACGEPLKAEEILDRFQDAFFRARRPSIDSFLQHHESEFGRLGRNLIATALLHCERDELLDRDWYGQLFDEVFPLSPNDLNSGMLSVITFNYDRSFEQFFVTALLGFNIELAHALKAFRRIKLRHVYGHLGDILEVKYGDSGQASQVYAAIQLVRSGEHPAREELNGMIREADNVVFIGFGFAPENLGLFHPSSFEGKSVVATTLGVSPNRISEARRVIPKLKEFDGSASQLFYSQEVLAVPKQRRRVQIIPVRGI